MNIYINLRDTASDFNHEVKITGASLTFNGALKTHKSEVETARKLAKEMDYKIEESVGDLSFKSFEEDNETQNHYNVLIQKHEIQDDRPIKDKLESCINTLREIARSGYGPFGTPPAPSSPELRLKKMIDWAQDNIEGAIYLNDILYGKK